MRFAYADPPYLGCAVKHYGHQHDSASDFDGLAAHTALVERLCDEYADGWALSMTSGNLHDILPLCPREARVMAWVKPFASFKPGVGVAYAWEPVVFMGGRKRRRDQPTVRDWVSANITLRKGVSGAKPPAFVRWLMDVFNFEPGDALEDLFPGSGAVSDVVAAWQEAQNGNFQGGMFDQSGPISVHNSDQTAKTEAVE